VTATGAVSTLAAFGVIALDGHVMKLDPVGVALGTASGLALGVAFALMVLDRFHNERRAGGASGYDAAAAAIQDLRSTGRAVLVGGSAIVLALVIAAIVGPPELLISLGTGMLTSAAFAIGGAVVVMPAALTLLGDKIEAFSFPAPRGAGRLWET